MSIDIPIDSTMRHAETLVETLIDNGPMTSEELRKYLAWTKGRLSTAIRYAREHLCPAMGLAFPNPTPYTGWTYQVTTEWVPIEEGASYALGGIETRLLSIHRDIETIFPSLTQGTTEWRRANFLRKHLGHITGTLKEINGG